MVDRRRKRVSPFARIMNLKSMVRLTGQQTIFPFYHVVSNRSLSHIKHLYHYRDESEFERDLDHMLRFFEPVSMERLGQHEGQKTSGRHMVLSFDDGLMECHQFIAPLLQKKGVPAIFFLNNQFIDNQDLFYRYKASILIDRILSNRDAMANAADYLALPEEQLVKAIQLIKYRQQPLLDAIAPLVEIDYTEYLKRHPVYMTSDHIKDLVQWGFDLGGHSSDHFDFAVLQEEEMIEQVKTCIQDLRKRFALETAYFAFPFTSEGVPERVINQLLKEGSVEAIFGTAGMKKTGIEGFIQRIPMEVIDQPALNVLKTEYLYYLLKNPVGRNKLRY